MWVTALIICITHTSACDCICHCGVLNDQCVLQLSDTVGLLSHLCTRFNGRVREETEASQSRAGLSPWEPKSAPGHLLTCLPLRRTCSSLTACARSLMLTLSHFLIYTLNLPLFFVVVFLHIAAHLLCLFFGQYLKLSFSVSLVFVHTHKHSWGAVNMLAQLTTSVCGHQGALKCFPVQLHLSDFSAFIFINSH